MSKKIFLMCIFLLAGTRSYSDDAPVIRLYYGEYCRVDENQQPLCDKFKSFNSFEQIETYLKSHTFSVKDTIVFPKGYNLSTKINRE